MWQQPLRHVLPVFYRLCPDDRLSAQQKDICSFWLFPHKNHALIVHSKLSVIGSENNQGTSLTQTAIMTTASQTILAKRGVQNYHEDNSTANTRFLHFGDDNDKVENSPTQRFEDFFCQDMRVLPIDMS